MAMIPVCSEADDDECKSVSDASWITWLALILLSLASFWVQAVTTEERFVPALNVIAARFNIHDDVAGATLMAAGASSPEFFSAVVSVFITRSSLGLGTIVGSEIFNELCICAGSVLAARQKTLYLDRAIVIREVTFYGLSIFLLLVTLRERHPLEVPVHDEEDGDNDDGGELPDDEAVHMFISFYDSSLLFGAYIVYVLVLWRFDDILQWFKPRKKREERENGEGGKLKAYGAIETEESGLSLPPTTTYVRQLSREPRKNFRLEEDSMRTSSRRRLGSDERAPYQAHEGFPSTYRGSEEPTVCIDGGHSIDPPDLDDGSGSRHGRAMRRLQSLHERAQAFSQRTMSSFGLYEVSDAIPADLYGLEEIVLDDGFDGNLSCFLWERSNFYDRAKIALRAWQLRWFTFDRDYITSVSSGRLASSDGRAKKYPTFDKVEIDEAHLIVTLISTVSEFECSFMAPTQEVLDVVVVRCKELTKVRAISEEAEAEALDEQQEDDSIMKYHGASSLGLVMHFLLLPLKFLMHHTMPDVRRQDAPPSLRNASIAILSCLAWIIVASYFMVSSLERLAELMGVPDSVVGVTVSAAGTSLPNYVASQVAARQGLGNMAVSNAFGSNIFNIMVGLGLPWMLYTGIVLRGSKYHDLLDEGIEYSVIVLAVVLLAFVVLVAASGFVLYRWHAYAFYSIYALYLLGEVLQVYW